MRKFRWSYSFLLSLSFAVWFLLPAVNLCNDLLQSDNFSSVQFGELGEEESESSEKEGADDDVKCSLCFGGRSLNPTPFVTCNGESKVTNWELPYFEGLLDPPESLI